MLNPAKGNPAPPAVDEKRMGAITKSDFPQKGELEIGNLYTMIPIGQPNERKLNLQSVLVTDADTGFLYTAKMLDAGLGSGQFLLEGLLDTIEKGKFIPAKVRVDRQENRIYLNGVAERLGIDIVVSKELRALEEAKRGLFQHMGIKRR